MTRVFAGLAEFAAATGQELGSSAPRTVTQADIDRFADATGDHQWIHVDPQRAARGPFGATVAHGFLTLALVPVLLADIFRIDGLAMAVNYGVDRVRFPAPLHPGTAIRATATLLAATPQPPGLRTVIRVVLRADGAPRPVCVADTVAQLIT